MDTGSIVRDKCQRAEKAANLGSSTLQFRTTVQPHIQEQLIAPLERNGWQVCHMDMKAEDGVDVIADVSDPGMATRFKDQFTLTICTNMLEHVADIGLVALKPDVDHR